MKILFISDIHGIIDNLKIIDDIMKKDNIDKLIVLGDLYHPSLFSENKTIDKNYIINFLSKYKNKLIVMKGNCDTYSDIENSPFKINEDFLLINIDGINIYLTHGDKYRYLKNDYFNDGVLIYGHEHIPYIKQELDMVYINTGSISLPRNNLGASYTIYENKEFKIYSVNNKIIDKVKIK